MADTAVSQDGQVEHIGAASHPTRNLIIVIGALLLLGAIGFYRYLTGRSGDAAAAEHDLFRQAAFAQCKLESFSGPTHPQLAALYAKSSRMRAVVQEQLGALERGRVNCDQLVRALRSVDYPIP